MTTTRRRQDRYDLDGEVQLPELADVSARASRMIEQDRLELVSAYYDTDELDLLRAEVTLRRRRGVIDPGWQVKIADHDLPADIYSNDGSDNGNAVPKQLRDLLAGVRRGRPLHKAAELCIVRDVRRIVDSDGHLLASLYDDVVTVTPGADGSPATRWRELEVVLDESGDEQLLAVIGARLTEAGARQSDNRSKLVRAVRPRPGLSRPAGRDGSTAGAVIGDYLVRQRIALLHGDIALRAGHEAVPGDVRLAVARLRNVLRVFADLYSADRASALEADLGWLLSLLTQARRPAVLREHLTESRADLPGQAGRSVAAEHLDQALCGVQQHRREVLLHALHGIRYGQLLDELGDWVADPPATAAAAEPAKSLLPVVRAAQHSVAKRLRSVALADADEVSVRRLRKAVGRARDAMDAAQPVLAGHHLAAQARRYQRLQVLLRDYKHATDAARFLAAHADDRPAEDGFACGVLYAREVQHADDARDQLLADAGRFS